ncbi:MAG: precorrin-6Y C5,15-methyltransferase (decarboxylating) subunit CbiT [Lachnospiraceae bacterium]|nr:precorrin-6Y C5,15-methyltransferase (decarboxylating) subunit CbiT [Lachnospiraceae bacterium]
MKIFLIGCGPGAGECLTTEAVQIIKRSAFVLGTERVLRGVQAFIETIGACDSGKAEAEEAVQREYIVVKTYTEEALKQILKLRREDGLEPQEEGGLKPQQEGGLEPQREDGLELRQEDTFVDEASEKPCISVLYSGDSGFYSGAGKLNELLIKEGLSCELVPGISSLQYFAARLKEDWQDWLLLSSHGKYCNVLKEICRGKPVFLLTGSIRGAINVLRELAEAGLSELAAAVGTDLSYPEKEEIIRGSVGKLLQDLNDREGKGLLVLLIYPPRHYPYCSPGIPDKEFVRGERPMTKRTIRALVMAALQLNEKDTVLDIGAGTGGMSIELSMQAGRVFAIEKEEEEGIRLLGENRKHFGAWNLCIIQGRAPEALYEELQGAGVNKVFIGGSDGNLAEILDAVCELYGNVEICLTAITLETVGEALAWFRDRGFQAEITELTVANSEKAGKKHMMKGENPVYIILGRKMSGSEEERSEAENTRLPEARLKA